jgi:hypothetical protein
MTKASSSSRGRAAAVAVLAFAALVFDVHGGVAQAAKRRVGVTVNGSPSNHARAAIGKVLKRHGFEVVSPDLGGETGDAIAAAAKQGRLAAVVVGEVKEAGKRLKLRVYGASGDLIGESSWAEKAGPKKVAAVVERTMWTRVGGSLSRAHAAGVSKSEAAAEETHEQAEAKTGEEPSAKEAEDKSEDKSEEKSEDKSEAKSDDKSEGESKEPESKGADEEGEAPRKKKKHHAADEEAEADEGGAEAPADTALDISVGPRFLWRNYTFGGSTLTPYSVPHAPSIGAVVAWYPAAHVTSGWPANLGIAAALELTPGLKSKTQDGTQYPTSASDVWVGARGRMRLGPVEGALTLGGGQQAFIFHSEGAADRATLALLTDVKYTYLRAAVDLRITLVPNLSLLVGGGLRDVLSAGDQNYLVEANSYLPNAKVLGFEASAGVAYRFLSMLEARAGFDLRRYQITAGANTYMATTGTDQYTTIWAALAFLLDGVGGHEAAAEAPAAAEAKPAKKPAKADDEDHDAAPQNENKSEDPQ